MADQNTNQNFPPVGGTNKDVDVRTMASDLNSIQGGGSPESYSPSIPTATPSETTPGPVPDANFQIPSVPAAAPENLPANNGGPKPKKSRGALVGLIVFLVVVALGALGYFVVYPMFTTANPNSQTSSVNTAPQPVNNTSTETTTLPAAAPESTSSTSTSPMPSISHQSLFKTVSAAIISTSSVSASTLSNLNISTTSNPALVEVVFEDQNGNPLTLSDMLKSLISADLTKSGLDQAFDPAYTSAFVYLDGNGTRWLGFVAKLSATSSLVDEKASFGQILESNTNLKNFFSKDPGTEGAWKNGDSATSNRYVLFSKNGYTIDYGWNNDTLVISSSYDGYKAALGGLQ